MNWKDLYKIKLLIIIILATLCLIGSYVLYFLEMDEDTKAYIIGGLGLIIIIFPLVSIARYGNRLSQKLSRGIYLCLGIISVVYLVLNFIIGDSLLIAVILLVASTFWTANLLMFRNYFEKIKLYTRNLTSLSAIFMTVMCILYYINTTIVAIDKMLMPVPECIVKLLIGIAIVTMCIFTIKVAQYRIAFVFNFLLFIIWFFEFDTSWMFRNYDRVIDLYLGTLIFSAVVYYILILNVGLSFGRFLYESSLLKRDTHSILLGPWFKNLLGIKGVARLDTDQKKKMKSGLVIFAVFSAIAIPGILGYMNLYMVPITITPQSQNVTWNFWASQNIDTDYTATEKAEMNEHKVNLDITLSMSPAGVDILKKFEAQMPDITYRLTINPGLISNLLNNVMAVTELMLECEDNGTLDQWKGFCFDIEGNAYAWYKSFDSIQDSIDIWNDMFDYLDQKSLERNKTIETECVNAYEFAVDGMFDGDYDQQFMEGFNSYVPERFTHYAPMIYRCWPVEAGAVITDAPRDPLEYWMTSYYVYTGLYTLQAGVPDNKMGVYLGITNCTCYSADVPQDDPASWGDGTGFGNLKRDVLIAKSFGIKEVTFFLQFNAFDGAWFGSAFQSYGDGFLDELNETVNTNPPEEFTIYLNNLDGSLQDKLGRDLFCNFSGWGGMIQIAEICIVTGIIYAFLRKNRSKITNSIPR